MVEFPITFEWKPNKCHHSKVIGHSIHECRLRRTKHVRVAKSKSVLLVVGIQEEGHVIQEKESVLIASQSEKTTPEVDQEGF